MWYLIAGKVMSLIIYFMVCKAFLYVNQLDLLDRVICWFFIEHLFEEYNIPAGKFFLTNLDFRMLIKNIVIVFRNVFIWSHFVTFTEFLLIISVLILISYFLFHFLKLKIISLRIRELFIFSYYTIITYLILLRIFFSFDLLDIYFIFKPITAILFFFSCFFILIRLYFFLANLIVSKSILRDYSIILFFLKIVFYMVIFTCLIILFLCLLSMTFELTHNLIQEFLIKILIVYTFNYYF